MTNTKTSGATKSTDKKVSKSSYTKKVETVIPQDDVKAMSEESFVPNDEVVDAPVESTVEGVGEPVSEHVQSQDIKDEYTDLAEGILTPEGDIVDDVETIPEENAPVTSVFSPKPLAPKAKVAAAYGATKFC